MNEHDIDSLIIELAKDNKLRGFYPIAISKTLNLPINPVLERLKKLADIGWLDLKYEIKCFHDNHILKIVDDYSEYINQEMVCDLCGENVTIRSKDIFPKYFINDKYRHSLKKNKKNRKRRNYSPRMVHV